MNVFWTILVVAVLVVGASIYTFERRAYFARKEASLKQSAAAFVRSEADKITSTIQDQGKKVT